MKKKPETTRAVESLPSFLDSPAGGDETTTTSELPVEATEAPATPEPAAAESAENADGEPAAAEAANDPEPPAAEVRRRRSAPLASSPRAGGTLAIALGFVALLGAPVSGFVPDLANHGFTPNLLFVLGAMLVAAGMTQRHVCRMQQRLDEAENRRREEATSVHQNLQLLVDDSQREKVPVQGEELQHILMAQQRQDEKINNLTKAIKMYGKPLMEISGQSTEFASSLSAVKALVEESTESARQSVEKIEAQVRTASSGKDLAEVMAALQKVATRLDGLATNASSGKDLAEVMTALQKVATRLDGLANKAPAPTVSFEPLQQQLGRLEVGLAAVAQRLEDNEVRKSLLRLEESTQKGREAMQELLKGDSVRSAAAQLQSRVDNATKGLTEGLAKLRDGNLGGLETAVREIQREVSGVATTVSQINAAMKSGARAAAATPAPAATTTAANAPTAPTSGASVPAPVPVPAAAAAAGAAPAGYATGARTSGAKNVLGAIAKLKQMKG